ncbi:DUF4139 domain-containing protein [Methylopila sp. M107]|uniref:DUF4139 domain-containing protein n=1 Tax=Methylopila sp. M107 TaxID=1101190 RepID=UPI00035FCFA2|nr:DUF4139 domain-containing protein [Methylopila sp. M107]
MLKSRLLAAVSLFAVALATPAFADVTDVTLSSGGLAEIVSAHEVDGDGVIKLEIAADQLDDILKSLVVRDAGGAVGSIRLDGPAQAEETLKRMPFRAEDIASPARLLTALQGVSVRIESGGDAVEGKSLGVSERNGGQNAGAVRTASVLKDDGAVATIALGDGAVVKILDTEMAEKLVEATGAIARTKADGARVVEISLAGAGKRKVAVSYVVPAPLWKTAYRVMSDGSDKARLQAWAIIENATGEDWKNVSMTLQTGAPVTLKQRLLQRYWRQRPEVPVDVEQAIVPELDQGAVEARRPKAQQGRTAMRTLAAPAPAPVAGMADSAAYLEAEPARAAETAETVESDVSASYRLPSPVTLEAGRTLSTPIVDADVPAERVSLWRPGASVHPVAAISIKNDTKATLPPGLITVYDKVAGYVGDARLPATPAGEERMASFATDRQVTVTSDAKPEDKILSVKVVDGVAQIEALSREITDYTVKGAQNGPRTMVIEHSKREGWSLDSADIASETPTAYRLKAKIAAGEVRQVRAVYEIKRLDGFSLAEAGEDDLVRWSSGPADAKTAALLRELAAAKAASAEAERQAEDAGQNAERIGTDQGRLRENMKAVPPQSELGRSYLKKLEASEAAIDAETAARDKAEKRVKELQAQVRAVIARF